MLNDSDLEPKNILTFEEDEITLYITSIAILPEYQGTVAVKELSRGFIEHIRLLLSRGININKIMAVSISEKGYNFALKMGFKNIRQLDDKSNLLSVSINEFLDFHKEE